MIKAIVILIITLCLSIPISVAIGFYFGKRKIYKSLQDNIDPDLNEKVIEIIEKNKVLIGKIKNRWKK